MLVFETFLVEGVKRFIQAVNELGKPFATQTHLGEDKGLTLDWQ